MAVLNLRKYRRLIIVMLVVMVLGVAANSTHWLLRILYPIHYRQLIEKYSAEYNLDPYLVAAIIRTESRFNEKARSRKDAKGLMQIAPITGAWAAKDLSLENYSEEMLYVPEINIRIGCWYIDKLRTEFNGRLQLMLAAYNGGSGNVNKWLKDPKYSADGVTLKEIPFGETKLYVEKVLKSYKIYSIIYR
ncbi:lytic transglycosylase domain-containing protein [Thermotalea metallivorans]|uniref:Soluble lytic murein transglycosylase n=1 Tax=Thermotalea metallivorans TaxID=520762 RepID=A0A140L968_9FIRM|nr:lytic transglycosylase domain-containing protein [Thermotalea metallivorans]KXG77093.1 Soluble lytic murein transglycosylase [Thermotalea metallivorans]